MHPCLQGIFVTCDTHQELNYEGSRIMDRWKEGVLKTPDGHVYAHVKNGVPLFLQADQDPWGDDEAVAEQLAADQANRETVIAKNWKNALTRWQQMPKEHRVWVEKIATQGGLTLILACGPAGSHAPELLDVNPQTKLLMNDIGRWIVMEWQRFSDQQKMWPHFSCAQFDAQRFPICEGVLDCVDSRGAMSEIPNSLLAMTEAFRSLKPGGKLFLSEGILDPECIQEFPIEGRQQLENIGFNTSEVGYKERLLSIGYDIVSYKQWGPRIPELGRSTLADIGEKYGIQIRLYAVEVIGQKL